MIKRALLALGMVAVLVSAAPADIPGRYIYYGSSSDLYLNDSNWALPDIHIGAFTHGPVTDIAFNYGTTDLYGIGSNGYSFVLIDKATGATTIVDSSVDYTNGLASYALNKFYAASSGGSFYKWELVGGSIVSSPGDVFNDINGETSFNGSNLFVSAGDIWVTSDGATVYATVTDLTAGYLVTVDPDTAEVDWVATLPSKAMYGLAEDDNGVLYLLENEQSKKVYKLSGSSLVEMAATTGDTWGATATVVLPAPAAIVLGLIGMTVLGLKLRKLA